MGKRGLFFNIQGTDSWKGGFERGRALGALFESMELIENSTFVAGGEGGGGGVYVSLFAHTVAEKPSPIGTACVVYPFILLSPLGTAETDQRRPPIPCVW